jgi:hypothetical protein
MFWAERDSGGDSVRPMKRELILVIALIGCGPSTRGSGDQPDAPGGGGGDDGGGGGSGSGDNCSDDAKLIFTIDTNRTLSKFNPTMKQFMDIGQLNCPARSGSNPFSMGIDRDATAWVLYTQQGFFGGLSSELFRVDTTTLDCTKTTWQSGNQGHDVFGMGFSTDAVGGTDDTLFIAGGSGPSVPSSKLAKMDMGSFAPSTVGNVTGWPELTGNSNAELWGFFPAENGTRVERLDKASGGPAQTFMLPSLDGSLMGAAWAFAFYGGDYWIFLKRGAENATTVYQMNGMTGAITSMTATNTRRIVGAGVSTCAPVVIF